MRFHPSAYGKTAARLLSAAVLLAPIFGLGNCARSKDPLEEMRIDEPATYFKEQGFVEMVPPLRLPLRSLQNRVEVWLKIPSGALMTVRMDTTGPRLALPPGSIAARVELLAAGGEPPHQEFFAADVRGTRFAADSEHFFVLKPTARGLPAPLRGWSWKRGSATEQSLADDRLAELVGATASAGDREDQMSAVRATNACVSCHIHSRNENLRPGQYGNVNRGTDGSGCFQVQSILRSELPSENYFPIEANLGDPFLTFWCGSERARAENEHWVCPDGSVPRGRLAVREALAAANDHAQGVCRSRRYLSEHLSPTDRKVFEQSLSECQVAP